MNNKIYLLVQGSYSDWDIVGYFTSEEDAKKFAVLQYGRYDNPHVVDVDCLDGRIDLSKVEVLYKHEVVFDKVGGSMVMRNEPNRYVIYGGDIKNNSIYVSPYRGNEWINVIVNQKKFDRKKAEKIAQNIMYQYLAIAREFNDKEAAETINYGLSAPQRAREEERKTEELRKTELAELERLKAKYEG